MAFDTVTGTYVPAGPGAPFPDYSPDKVQTYGVLSALFRFEPGPLTNVTTYKTTLAGPGRNGSAPFKLEQIKRPSDIIMVMDAAQIGNEGLYPKYPNLSGTWAADADLWNIQASQVQFDWYKPGLLLYCQTFWPNGPDAGFNQDWTTYNDMENATYGPFNSMRNDLRFRHMNNTQANALFADGHCGSFSWKHPGSGGTDLQFKNFILDDYKTEYLNWAPNYTPH